MCTADSLSTGSDMPAREAADPSRKDPLVARIQSPPGLDAILDGGPRVGVEAACFPTSAWVSPDEWLGEVASREGFPLVPLGGSKVLDGEYGHRRSSVASTRWVWPTAAATA